MLHLLEPSSSENSVLPEQNIAKSGQSEGGVVPVDKISTTNDGHVREHRGLEREDPSASSTPKFLAAAGALASHSQCAVV